MGKRLRQFDRERHLAELKVAYEEGGLTIKELATLYGVSYGTMHFRLNAAGVTMRPRNDQPVIGDPLVPPISLPCPKCGAVPYKRCHNTYGMSINDFHVSRRRAAADELEDEVDKPCET